MKRRSGSEWFLVDCVVLCGVMGVLVLVVGIAIVLAAFVVSGGTLSAASAEALGSALGRVIVAGFLPSIFIALGIATFFQAVVHGTATDSLLSVWRRIRR